MDANYDNMVLSKGSQSFPGKSRTNLFGGGYKE